MQLSIGKRLLAGFGVLTVIIGLSAVWSYCKTESMLTLLQRIAIREPSLTTSLDAISGMNQQVAALRGEVNAAPNSAEAAAHKQKLAESRSHLHDAAARLQELASHYRSAANKERIAFLVQEVPLLDQVAEQIESASDRGDKTAAASALALYGQHQEQIEAKMRQLLESVTAMAKKEDEAMMAAGSSTETVTILGTLMAMLLAGFIAVSNTRALIRPLRTAAERANAIAEGDLTGQELEIRLQDETGELMQAINGMQKRLGDLLAGIGQNAQTLANAAEEISSTASQASSGTDAQSEQVAQVATAIQQMASSLLQVSENSNRAADAARHAADAACHGGEIVDQSLSDMRSISDAVTGTAQKIQELGRSSDQIGKIVGVIDEIADQTNLLALNAAIEAARAGEQGRGFAVVADEVRKLAERTTKATKEIAEMITHIQEETRRAVATMEGSRSQVEHGVSSTTAAGDSLREIIESSERVGDMIAQIATATTQQSSTTEQISSNIEQITKISQESASGAQESARACQELSNLALDLQQLVARFHVGVQSNSAPRPRANFDAGFVPPMHQGREYRAVQ